MSLLVVGLSHHTAPLPLLERAALPAERVDKLLGDAVGTEYVHEAIAIATCNRLEVYAEVAKFHGALADLSELIGHYSGVPLEVLTGHFYVHYDNRAVQHMFNVACGLDSMVVGEPQILGQLRAALAAGQARGTAGRVLNDLAQSALRVGKRAHSETGLDQAGQSLVSAALELAVPALADRAAEAEPASATDRPSAGSGTAPVRAAVIGAGSMSSLAATTLSRQYPGLDLVVVNRTAERAERLAASVGGRAAGLDRLAEALTGADLIVSCTGATEVVLTAELIRNVADPSSPRPRVVVDLALPRDVDPAVAELPGVTLIDLGRIADAERDGGTRVGADSVEAVRRIVAAEVAAYDLAQQAAAVGPTVAALRGMAAVVVESELARFDGRVPGLDEKSRAEVANTVRRVVDKLLHEPTVRVKQLAADPDGTSYAAALRELFNLDPAAAAAVSLAESVPAQRPGGADHDQDAAREEGRP